MLEGSLHTALFRREAGGIGLTEAGRKLEEYARRIVELHRGARRAIAGRRKEVAGDLLLAASSIPGEHVLPPILAAFRRAQPQVNVRLRVMDTEEVCRILEDDEADLGFTGDAPASRRLVFTPFADDDLGLVVPANHRLSRRRRVGWRDILRELLIMRERGSGSRRCLERALRRAGRKLDATTPTLEVGSNEAIKEAVLEGLGVSVLSRRTVHKEIVDGRLCLIPLAGVPLVRRLFIVRNRERRLTAAAREFLDQFRREAAGSP
jgi:DNA-binding transcriptional LysR family regulator